MEGDSTVPLLFWHKTAGQSLQCADAHYCKEERSSDLHISGITRAIHLHKWSQT